MCEIFGYVVVLIDSISSYRIYSSWSSQSAKINSIKKIDGQADKKETEAIEEQLNSAVDASERSRELVQASPREVSSLPWANLMYKLNLTPTGDYKKDYNTTISRLDELIKYTRNPDKLQEYLSLADDVSIVFVQPHVSSMSQTTSVLSGTEQIAQLNKIMMLNLGAK